MVLIQKTIRLSHLPKELLDKASSFFDHENLVNLRRLEIVDTF